MTCKKCIHYNKKPKGYNHCRLNKTCIAKDCPQYKFYEPEEKQKFRAYKQWH